MEPQINHCDRLGHDLIQCRQTSIMNEWGAVARTANSGQKAIRSRPGTGGGNGRCLCALRARQEGGSDRRFDQRDSRAHLRANGIPINRLSRVHAPRQGLAISPGLRELLICRVLEDPVER